MEIFIHQMAGVFVGVAITMFAFFMKEKGYAKPRGASRAQESAAKLAELKKAGTLRPKAPAGPQSTINKRYK